MVGTVAADDPAGGPAHVAARTTARLVRLVAMVSGLLSVVLVVLGLAGVDAGPIPGRPLAAAAVTTALAALFVLLHPLEEVLLSGDRRWVVDAHPLYVMCVGATFVGVYGTTDFLASGMAMISLYAGLAARPPAVVLTVLAGAAGILTAPGALEVPADAVLTPVFVATTAGVGWGLATAQRRALTDLARVQLHVAEYARAVEVVAAAPTALDVPDLRGLDAFVDVAVAAAGWSAWSLHLMLAGGRVVHRGPAGTAPVGAAGIVDEVAETRGPVVRAAASPESSAALGLPLTHGVDLVGVLVVGEPDEHAGWRDRRLLELLAVQLERALEATRAVEAHRAAVEASARATRARDDFVATISHELRTPLAVVHGMSETLADRWDDLDEDRRRGFARKLFRHARDMVDLVDVLLDFARLDGGKREVAIEPFDVAVVTQVVVERLRELRTDHELVLEAAPVGAALIEGDAVLIDRVVENLVRNACDHTPAGTRVSVSTVVEDGEVLVSVRDQGPGMTEAELSHVGERFFRGEAGHLRQRSRGLGLGLAFCCEVLRRHGTRLDRSSQLGVGSTFSFRLPRAGRSAPESIGGDR